MSGPVVVEVPTDKPDTSESDYPLIWCGSLRPHLDVPSLMDQVFKPESMAVTYGESNSGKTFHVIDQDMCIASGTDWFDRNTVRTPVVYVAGEGPHSVENRAYALQRHKGLDIDPSFALMPYPVNLFDENADTRPIIEFIKRTQDQMGEPVGKVTIDTLSRAMAGGNENAADDMGRLVRHADLIRHECGVAVHFVHHAGKDAARGARGHSSLRAATDTEIEVTAKDGMHIAKITKQRDWPTGDEFAFRLIVVDLGKDPNGNPVTTCVPQWDMSYCTVRDKPKPSGNEQVVLDVIKEIMSETKKLAPIALSSVPSNRIRTGQLVCPVDDLRVRCLQRGIGTSDNPDSQTRVIRRALTQLQTKNIIQVFDNYAWLVD